MEFNGKMTNIVCQPASALTFVQKSNTRLKQRHLDYYTSDGFKQQLNKHVFQKAPSRPKRYILDFEEETLTIERGDGSQEVKSTQGAKAITKPRPQTPEPEKDAQFPQDAKQPESNATTQWESNIEKPSEVQEPQIQDVFARRLIEQCSASASLDNYLKVPVLKNTKNKFLCKWRNKDNWTKRINLNKTNGAIITGKDNNLIVLDIDVKKDGMTEWHNYVKKPWRYSNPNRRNTKLRVTLLLQLHNLRRQSKFHDRELPQNLNRISWQRDRYQSERRRGYHAWVANRR
jgi:hypothetical protein